MIDRCDTCGRLAELSQLPGRKDSNCVECNADISILVLLYRRFEVADPDCEDAAYLENRLITVLQRFLARSKLDPSVQFCSWHETVGKENHVN